ncbi:MAG TPA: cobalamin B12-binding domain-containing protein, partial [Armatimonadota bacterium]|nr:cobalamin B12-binding domain-containing protein [Armatimonadota bacterium]
MRSPTVLFIGAEDEENLAIRSLAAFVRAAGIRAKIAPFCRTAQTDGVLRAAARLRPHVIAVSMPFQSLASDFFRLIARLREAGYRGHVVVGGHFPTFEYARILETQPGIDSVMRFEGEHGL